MSKRTRGSAQLCCEALEARDVPAGFNPVTASDLVAAVVAANQNTEADIISLVPGATYTLTTPSYGSGGSATGLPLVTASEPLRIVGNGATVERSTAGLPPYFRLLTVSPGATLTVENLTVQGGYTAFGASGGGILNYGTLTLLDVTVQNNERGSSSGVVDPAPAGGGGIYSSGSLTIQGGTIRGNSATGDVGGAGLGGGVFIAGGTANLNSVAVVGNTARGGPGYYMGADGGDGLGGGIYVDYATVSLRNLTVTDNRAEGGAGGPRGTVIDTDRDARKRKITIRAGASGDGTGGGLYLAYSAAVTLDSLTLANVKKNSASTEGRNIYGTYALLS